jgi:hypothetical protein
MTMLDDIAPKRRRKSGAQYERERRARMAAGGEVIVRLSVCIGDLDPLVASGDLSDSDMTNPERIASALRALLPRLLRLCAARDAEPWEEIAAIAGDDLPILMERQRLRAWDLSVTCAYLSRLRRYVPDGKLVGEILSVEQQEDLWLAAKAEVIKKYGQIE